VVVHRAVVAVHLHRRHRERRRGLGLATCEHVGAGIASPNCFLLVEPTAIVAELVDPFGCASFALNIPFNPTLRGLSYYSQWFVLDFPANPGGFVASSALSFTVR
jgi:hypothetical protein